LNAVRYRLRQATAHDKDLLAGLHERCYRGVVIAQFGRWDEALQREFFERKWDPARFQIVVWQDMDVGAIAVQRRPDHIFVAEVLIDPAYQNQGLGSEIVGQVVADAFGQGLAVRLQVLRENRARCLYERLGFVQTGRTDTHILMERTA
jgi:ribosomal protein S18 acetylase RimI-like enzyme